MADILKVKKWSEFQHYKHRRPTWIRLWRKILDDMDFMTLPIASKALAPMLWLVASESLEGVIKIAPELLAYRLRMHGQDLTSALKPLIDKGFFEGQGSYASSVLAGCERNGATEYRVQSTEKVKTIVRQTESDALDDDFCRFWLEYPKHEGKKKAHDRWTRMTLQDRLAAFAGLARWKESGRWGDLQFVPQALTYLNGRRWEDEIAPRKAESNGTPSKHEQRQRRVLEERQRALSGDSGFNEQDFRALTAGIQPH